MKADMECNPGSTTEIGRKPYRRPRIEDYGTVVELTGTGSGTIEDGGGPFVRSGAAG